MSFVTPKSKLSQRQIEGHENAISNRREHPIFVFSVGGARDLWNCVEELRNNHLIDYYTLFFFLPRSPNLQCQNVRKMWIISSKRVESLG